MIDLEHYIGVLCVDKFAYFDVRGRVVLPFIVIHSHCRVVYAVSSQFLHCTYDQTLKRADFSLKIVIFLLVSLKIIELRCYVSAAVPYTFLPGLVKPPLPPVPQELEEREHTQIVKRNLVQMPVCFFSVTVLLC